MKILEDIKEWFIEIAHDIKHIRAAQLMFLLMLLFILLNLFLLLRGTVL